MLSGMVGNYKFHNKKYRDNVSLLFNGIWVKTKLRKFEKDDC